MVSTRSAGRADSVDIDDITAIARTPNKRAANGSSSKPRGWSHTPTPATLLWMAVSLPLVIWDTVYVLGRPATMEGGWLHWPLYVPYELYAATDYVYGWPALESKSGFTSAQGTLNVIETLMYGVYMYLYFSKGTAVGAQGAKKIVTGKAGAQAVLIGFSAAVMTLSKTVLYFANEYYSGFANIGHNNALDLLFLWIIPNGAWIVASTYMTYSLGGDILEGLNAASHPKKE